ncbi:hypothetical protein [Arthrobacter sp. H20]|uniref:hypothetical protein n=1 Tax=Arthrobacter sp. H20 TaxID=1267981 RepID=UPI000479A579|nr:hypothetical protein [Arthrobacter sp. H20]
MLAVNSASRFSPPYPSPTPENAEALPVQQPSADTKERADNQESYIPGKRAAEIVTDMVNPQQLVIDQTFHKVEYPPPHKHQTRLKTPARRCPLVLPSPDGSKRASQHEKPRCDVKKPVGQRIHFQAGHRCYGMTIHITDHVVPLQDLMHDNAVDETTKTKPI